jgi:hypothetical protein
MKTGEGCLLDGCRAWTCELVATGIAEAQRGEPMSDESKGRLHEMIVSRPITLDELENYESPIHIIRECSRVVAAGIDDEVMKACMYVGIEVNKEELIKALEYDRDQYRKGFHDCLKVLHGCHCQSRGKEQTMSMLSLQTDHYRELAARSDDEEIKTALHQAAETIEDLRLKNEALSCNSISRQKAIDAVKAINGDKKTKYAILSVLKDGLDEVQIGSML